MKCVFLMLFLPSPSNFFLLIISLYYILFKLVKNSSVPYFPDQSFWLGFQVLLRPQVGCFLTPSQKKPQGHSKTTVMAIPFQGLPSFQSRLSDNFARNLLFTWR